MLKCILFNIITKNYQKYVNMPNKINDKTILHIIELLRGGKSDQIGGFFKY